MLLSVRMSLPHMRSSYWWMRIFWLWRYWFVSKKGDWNWKNCAFLNKFYQVYFIFVEYCMKNIQNTWTLKYETALCTSSDNHCTKSQLSYSSAQLASECSRFLPPIIYSSSPYHRMTYNKEGTGTYDDSATQSKRNVTHDRMVKIQSSVLSGTAPTSK